MRSVSPPAPAYLRPPTFVPPTPAYVPPPAFGARRDWAFYVQAAGLVGFWGFALTVVGWFAWRALALRQLGDRWLPAVFIGSLVGGVFLLLASVLTYTFLALGARGSRVHAVPKLEPGEEALLAPILGKPSPLFWVTVVALGSVAAAALYAWGRQIRYGLGETGLCRPVFWGFYIINFIFFIGISHAGTLISAILRISQAEWRRAITRSAEVITVLVLFFGAGNIILDMGRPDRLLNVFQFGRLESPLLWDVCSITTYLTGSTIYLYLPLIPDIAFLRGRVTGWRRHLYHLLSFGWEDTPAQRAALERVIAIMAVVVIPVAVSVHTVVSWVFSMTLKPMWHSTIFGPYFVVGAIYSGIAALLIAMAILRKAYRLEDFLKPVHFNYLGILMLVMTCLWFYFTFAEFLTTYYGGVPSELSIFFSKIGGPFSWPFWMMVVCCFFFPFAVLVRGKGRSVAGCVTASVSVVIGMWLERFVIIVPSGVRPMLPYPESHYMPSWVEILLFSGCIAAFCLLYVLFSRFFPIVSIWEVREGRHVAAREVAERVQTYFPGHREVSESGSGHA